MSQAGKFVTGGSIGAVLTLTGNSGGPVGPTGGNINVLGAGAIDIAGNPGTSTLTVSLNGSVATTYDADSGSATPAAGILNVVGGALGLATININTVGSGNTLDINLNDNVTLLGFLSADGNVITGSNFNMPATTADGLHGTFVLGGDRFITALGAGNSNTFVGSNSGNYTLNPVTTLGNVGVGADTLASIAGGEGNIAIGWTTLAGMGAADNNIAIGNDAMGVFAGGGDGNIAIGTNALDALGTGEFNVAIGYNSGTALTGTEDSNIYINNIGVVGESNTMRIGTTGVGQRQVDRAFMAGVYNVTPAVANPFFVVIDSNGQLGATTDSGEIATSFPTDSGTATPASGALNIFGDSSAIVTSGSGNTVTISFNPLLTTVNSTPYAVTNIDYYIAVDASGGPITINMPNATTTGRQFTIKDYLGQANINNIIVTTPGGVALFDGFTSYTLNVQYEAVNLVFDGTNYQLF